MRTSRTFRVCIGVVVAAMLIIASLLAIAATRVAGSRLLVVTSGSMSPSIPTGSAVLALPRGVYRPGDVLAFNRGSIIVTHRVVSVTGNGSNRAYRTKGDANKEPDLTPIRSDSVVGVVVISAPLLGYALSFAKTPPGLVTLVLVPCAFLLVQELRSLKDAWVTWRGRSATALEEDLT